MKKLMIALAAAATTMFSFGDVTLPTGTSFEALTEGPVTVGDIVGKDDTGNQDGENKFWYSAATKTDELGAITNEVAGAGVSRPDAFSTQGNTKSLQIDTTSPLFRTALPNSSGVQPVDIGDGIYLDTLVKFTAADEAFAENLTGGDKIAIEYVEHEAEGDDVGYTNFVVRAGLIGAELGQTNYFAAVPADFNKDEWHRLTVRTIADVGDGNVGFVIYLDGDKDKTLEYPTTVDAGFGTLNATAAKFYNNEKHALFPSAVAAEDIGGSTISSVAFSGSGFIDDVSFAAEAPQFIKAGEAVPVEITLGTGVADVTVTPYDSVATNGTTLVFSLPAGTTSFVLGVTADTANGYTFDEATGITLTDASYSTETDTVTITGGSPALTVVGKRDNAYYMDGETKVGFDTLSEAISSAPANATIKLGYNYSVTKDVVSDDAPVFVIAKDIVLDLNGKELDGGSGDARALFSVNFGCVLTVIDSVPGDDGSIIYGGTFGMFAGAGDTIIGSATDYGPVIIGAAIGNNGYVSEIVRGKFSATENTTADSEFVCGTDDEDAGINVIADDSTFSRVGDYWVVEPQGTPQPTTYAISWTLTGGTTTETAGDFEENAEIVFTADSGKTLSFVSINGTEIADTSVYGASSYTYTVGTAAATLVVTFTTPATPTYAISWTLTGGTTTETAGDFEENAEIVFTADTGKTLSFVSIDGTEIADTSVYGAGSYTYTVGTAAATLVVTFTGSSYPTYIDPTDAEETAKYTNWATYAGVDVATAELNEDAYLLNCLVSEVTAAKAAFKFTAFDQANPKDTTKTTTTTSYNGRDYNGTVVIKQYSDVGCTTESATGTFFRAVLQ